MTAPTLLGVAESLTTTSSINFTPSPAIPVDTVVIVTANTTAPRVLSISDAQGNTWQAHPAASNSTAPASATRVFTCRVTTAISGQITVSVDSAGAIAMVVATLPSTYDETPAETSTGFSDTNDNPHLAAAVTAPVGGGVAITSCSTAGNRTYTEDVGVLLASPLASGIGGNRRAGFVYVDTASSGTVQPSLTSSGNDQYAAACVLLVEATGGGTSQPINPTTETGTAQPLGRRKSLNINSTVETDTVAETLGQGRSINPASEANTSRVLNAVKRRSITSTTEPDTALSATVQQQNEINAGIALESDLSVQSSMTLGVGMGSESGISTVSSLALEAGITQEQDTVPVSSTTTDTFSGVATELDTALLAQTQQTSQAGVSAETDTVLTASTLTEISSETGVEVGSVPSSSTHQALTSSVSSETDTALSATTEEVITPGTVSETDVVVSASVNVLNNSGPALEIDSALPAMTDADGIVNAGVPVESNTALASSFEFESEISIESDTALPATVNFEGTEFNAGVASESDVVLQSSLLLQTSSPIAESDSSVGLSYSMTPGTPSETDSVPESSVVIQSGTVTESDSALSTFSSLSINAEVASESDSAVTPKLAVEVATSAETDAALTPLSGGSFNGGIAIETETTPSVLFDFSENAGISVENDSALPSSSGNLVFLGSAVELDQSLFTDLVISSSPTTENDSAIDASTTSNSFAGTSVENEFVPTSSVDQQLQVGPVIESDVAVIPSVMLKLGVSLEQDIALVSISGFIYKTRAIEDHIITVVKKNPPLILIIKDSES